MELQEGTEIKLLNGKTCTIDKELGRGGQGIVYLVDYCGGDYALKWYTKDYSNDSKNLTTERNRTNVGVKAAFFARFSYFVHFF